MRDERSEQKGTAATEELSRGRRLAILLSCCVVVLCVQIDSTGVNLALPSISKDLGASTGELQWVVDAYLLVLASLLMFSGALADRVGRRRVLVAGLLVFGLGSALCSVAVNPLMLIAMRGLQAVGGSALVPVAMSIIANVFTDPKERAQALGAWGAVVGVGMALGPLVGGTLVDAVDWRAVFWVNLPIVAVAVPSAIRVIPESRAAHARGADPAGQLLAALALGLLAFGIIEGGELGLGRVRVLASITLAVVLLVVFLAVERRTREPMLELRFFRSIPFSLSIAMGLLLFLSYAGFTFVATLYLQDVRGLEPVVAGLLTLPVAVSNGVMAYVSGWLTGRVGPRPPMVGGPLLIIAGAVILLTTLGPTTAWGWYVAAGLCIGGGLGLTNTPLSNTAVSGMPRDQAGVAGATVSTAKNVGQSLGVAVLGASLNAGIAAGSGFSDAARPGWWMVLALGLVLLVMAVESSTVRAKRSARRVAGLG